MTRTGETHSREVRFPPGARMSAEDVVALVALAGECAGELYWSVDLGERKLTGTAAASLEEGLRDTRGKIADVYCRAEVLLGENPAAIWFSLRGGKVSISGVDRNWAAGTRERF